MDYQLADFQFRGLARRNVILGKNGCGKSFVLKVFEGNLRGQADIGALRYISPERAGFLEYQGSIDQNVTLDLSWLDGERRRNQAAQFKQQSVALFRRLELKFLRKIEKEHYDGGYVPRNFDIVIEKINTLLDRVIMVRSDRGFTLQDRETRGEANVQEISSGESELVALAIECLAFVQDADPTKQNLLLMDEPDVHLHPDLQDRLAQFMARELDAPHITLIMATHSTALLASFARYGPTKVAFMVRKDKELSFKDVTDVHKRILPIFGAHPLSNVFNEAPVLLVEGEDDVRIWQQAVRSSEGRLSFFPCGTDSVDRLAEFETEANEVIGSVYDNARAYSLRDRDDGPETIDDLTHVRRLKLACRAAENLLLSDEALTVTGTEWTTMEARIRSFATGNTDHPYREELAAFIAGGLDRRSADLKAIRNILAGLMTNKPWEVVVGQAIAASLGETGDTAPGSLREFLGPRVCESLLAGGD